MLVQEATENWSILWQNYRELSLRNNSNFQDEIFNRFLTLVVLGIPRTCPSVVVYLRHCSIFFSLFRNYPY